MNTLSNPNQFPEEIPLEEFHGTIIPYDSSMESAGNPTTQGQDAFPEEIPIEEFKGELSTLTRMDLLEMIAKTGKEIVGDIHSQVNQEKTKMIEDLTRQLSRKDREGWVSDILKAFIKEPVKGLGSLADSYTTDPYNFAADTSKETIDDQKTASQYLPFTMKSQDVKPLINPEGFDRTDISFERGMGKAVDYATGGMTDSEYQSKAYENMGGGMHLLSQIASMGGIKKLATKYGWDNIAKIAGVLGSTDPKVLMGAFAFGTTDKYLENDPSMLKRLGMSTGAALGTEAVVSAVAGGIKNPRKVIQTVKDLPYKVAKVGLGITKGNFNKDIAKAFVDAGMEAPVSAVTDSTLVSWLNKLTKRIPYLAEKISERHRALESQFKAKVETVGDSIGAKKTDDVAEAISSSFAKMRELAGEGNVMDISDSLKVAEDIITQLKKAKANDDPSKAVISYLEDIIAGYKGGEASGEKMLQEILSSHQYNSMSQAQKQNLLKALNVAESKGITTVDAMIEQYQQLNGKMSDKNLFSSENGKRTLNLLHRFRNSLNNDFSKYGIENPAFNEARTEANKLFTQVKKREKWDAFWEKYTNHTEDTKRYKALSEALHDPKVKEELSNLLGEDTVDNLELLTKAAKGMAKSKLNDPNPSGSTIETQAKAFFSKWTGIVANGFAGALDLSKLVYTGSVTGGLVATSWALKSKNFVRKLVEFSERPTQSKAELLQKILKENTGLGIAELNKEMDSLKKHD
jgi:hypothetical protein